MNNMPIFKFIILLFFAESSSNLYLPKWQHAPSKYSGDRKAYLKL